VSLGVGRYRFQESKIFFFLQHLSQSFTKIQDKYSNIAHYPMSNAIYHIYIQQLLHNEDVVVLNP
jgi:hypothetical protein